MIVMTKDVDQAFYDAIKDKPTEWKYRAVAGLTTREVYCGFNPQAFEWAKQHGLSRASSTSEREAWLFGFEWPENALLIARAPLLDLLIGRMFRQRAEGTLQVALDIEQYGAPVEAVTDELDRAAHQEWIAVRSEYGQIAWGGRINRCGPPGVVEP